MSKYRFTTPTTGLPEDVCQQLVVAWITQLAADKLKFTQSGTGQSREVRSFTFGDPTTAHFTLELKTGTNEWSLSATEGVGLAEVTDLVESACQRASMQDWGQDIVYEMHMTTSEPDLVGGGLSLNMQRLLGDQVRINGPRRLSDRILLDFVERQPEDPAAMMLFAPVTEITVTIFVPGPTHGPLSQRTASGLAETTAAICALALGRAVQFDRIHFPADEAKVAAALPRRHDAGVLGLARDSVSLDVFGEFAARGGADGMLRVRGALLSYHAALQQTNVDIATMLLVTSMEALIVPREEWRKNKVTARFTGALRDLCPGTLNELLEHANVEEAFAFKLKGGLNARQRQLLDQIYALRSSPAHSGIGLSAGSALLMLGDGHGMRMALLSDLARGAILAFLQAPRSSLIGHPMFESQS